MGARDLFLKRQGQLDKKANEVNPQKAFVVEIDGSIWADENKRIVWVQRVTSTQAEPMRCMLINPVANTPIMVGFPYGGWPEEEVLSDDPSLRDLNPDGRSYFVPTSTDLEKGGTQALNIYPEMIVPLMTVPNALLTVDVVRGEYEYQGTRTEFLGAVATDLSASQPAGPDEHLKVGLYLDASNALQTVDGSTVATTDTAPDPTWPAGSVPLSTVTLNDTQTTISLNDDIENKRIFFTTSAGAATGTWPQADKLTNTADGSSFTTVATLITDLAANEQGLIGEGSFVGANLTLGADEHLLGSGQDVTELTNSTNSTSIVAKGGNTIQDMTINSTLTTGSTTLRADGDGVVCRNVKAVATATSNGETCYQAFGAEMSLYNCVGVASGVPGTDIALGSSSAGAVLNVHGGYFDGEVSASASTTINLYGPTVTGDIGGAGTITGYYFDADDKLYVLQGGDSLRYSAQEGVKVSHSTTQSISDSTFVSLAFDTEDWDDNTMHDTSTNNQRLVLKRAGRWFLLGVINYATHATGVRLAAFHKNASSYIAVSSQPTQSAVTARVIVAYEDDFAANDYVELDAWQNSTGSLNVASEETFFLARLIRHD